jgi:glycosyltransferase involved in cell wall biosynthesis
MTAVAIPQRAACAAPAPAHLPRLMLLRDFREEGWPSMDLCAEMLAARLREDHAEQLTVHDACPVFRRRLQRLPVVGKRRAAFNADRLLNRIWDYPRHVRRLGSDADLFHVVDHSYAQLVSSLPANRAGVFCHDLDAFRCLVEPARERRPRWFRALARRILHGLQRAAVVFYSTQDVRSAIERHQLVDPTRLVHAPYGFAPEFCAEAAPNEHAEAIRQQLDGAPYVLHVGSCIPRKRIDVLLAVVAGLRSKLPLLRLVKVGGEWTAAQRAQLGHAALADAVIHVTEISRATLAGLYRGAALVLMPSEAEGFGLPVVEALACGACVLASDLPVFREVGGDALAYAVVGDVEVWTSAAHGLLRELTTPAVRQVRTAQARRYSWARHAEIIADAYLGLMR